MSTRRERTKAALDRRRSAPSRAARSPLPAYGFVEVYSNNFNNKPQYRSVKTVTSGNKCERELQGDAQGAWRS